MTFNCGTEYFGNRINLINGRLVIYTKPKKKKTNKYPPLNGFLPLRNFGAETKCHKTAMSLHGVGVVLWSYR